MFELKLKKHACRTLVLTLLFGLTIVYGCSSNPSQRPQEHNYLDLHYLEFGSDSRDIIWPQYWQWPDSDNHKPASYNIRVLIYQNLNIEEVEAMFPTIPENKQDYRYITKEAAVNYLSTTIEALEKELIESNPGTDCEGDVVYYKEITQLYKTLVKIERGLPD